MGCCRASIFEVRKKKGPGFVWHCSQLTSRCAVWWYSSTYGSWLLQALQNPAVDVKAKATPTPTTTTVRTIAPTATLCVVSRKRSRYPLGLASCKAWAGAEVNATSAAEATIDLAEAGATARPNDTLC
jgi:hypothetical protein